MGLLPKPSSTDGTLGDAMELPEREKAFAESPVSKDDSTAECREVMTATKRETEDGLCGFRWQRC